jgi:hypothetical protein
MVLILSVCCLKRTSCLLKGIKLLISFRIKEMKS